MSKLLFATILFTLIQLSAYGTDQTTIKPRAFFIAQSFKLSSGPNQDKIAGDEKRQSKSNIWAAPTKWCIIGTHAAPFLWQTSAPSNRRRGAL